jgi:hypothetical protein
MGYAEVGPGTFKMDVTLQLSPVITCVHCDFKSVRSTTAELKPHERTHWEPVHLFSLTTHTQMDDFVKATGEWDEARDLKVTVRRARRFRGRGRGSVNARACSDSNQSLCPSFAVHRRPDSHWRFLRDTHGLVVGGGVKGNPTACHSSTLLLRWPAFGLFTNKQHAIQLPSHTAKASGLLHIMRWYLAGGGSEETDACRALK